MPIPTGYTIPNQVGQYLMVKAAEIFETRGANGERVITSTAADDENYSLSPGFNVPFYGVNQSIYVNSNSYVTFGVASTSYRGLSLTSTRGIYIKAKDNSIRYLSEKTFNGKYHTVRYEGQFNSNLSSTSVPNYWEISFFIDGVIQLNNIQGLEVTGCFSGITNGNTTTGNVLSLNQINSYVFMPKENPNNGYYYGEGSYSIVETDNTHPMPTIVSNSKAKLSRITDFRQSSLVFKFDKKVTQWTVNIGGTSPTTGYIADSGGTVNANTNITAIVDDMELQNEGQNRVNIYGKSEDGLWTPYEG